MAYTGGVPLSPEREAMKRATYEDVLNAPENKVAEILDGELVLSPRPAIRHSLAASTLGAILGEPFGRGRGGPGGWWVLDEPELHFGEHVVVPDLAGWRRERLPSVPVPRGSTSRPTGCARCCRLLPRGSTEAASCGSTPRPGSAHLWLLDPLEQTLEVLRLREGAWTIVDVLTGKATVRAEPFDADRARARGSLARRGPGLTGPGGPALSRGRESIPSLSRKGSRPSWTPIDRSRCSSSARARPSSPLRRADTDLPDAFRLYVGDWIADEWRFDVVRLWEIDVEGALQSGEAGPLALVPLLRGGGAARQGRSRRCGSWMRCPGRCPLTRCRCCWTSPPSAMIEPRS